MNYRPSEKILERYADVLVNFALGGGAGMKKREIVRVSAHESAKPLFAALQRAILKAGGHMIGNYLPDDESGEGQTNMGADFFKLAKPEQLAFFPKKYLKSLAETVDHTISIISDADMHSLKGIDPKKLMARGEAMKPARDWYTEKEHRGTFTWTLALYGTPAMAREAGLTEDEYWNQIIKACFLDETNPIKKWREVYKKLEHYRAKLNKLSPKIDRLHVEGEDADLWVKLGEKRQWLGGSGRNIPSFELFTSPDCRGTEGWIRFNQPLYRYGNKIEGIELEFKGGKVVNSRATSNEALLKEMIATPGANMIGEYSLTDHRFSRISRFMAETLYDENMGGPHGNTHLALGMSYKDTFTGPVAKLTAAKAKALGFNDSSVHTDIVSTTPRTVTAHLKDGKRVVIYQGGEFVF